MEDLRKAGLSLCQMELHEANAVVEALHRHHKSLHRVRFSIGCKDASGKVVGVVMCGRPVNRNFDPKKVLEVSRLATDGTPNACSFLYQAGARAAFALGYETIQTYILATEPGVSLKAAGWAKVADVLGRQWEHTDGRSRRTDQPTDDKTRWERRLR